ncbi:MAG: DUF1573 domain-containing protein [Isosphaeraceae bacterium]
MRRILQILPGIALALIPIPTVEAQTPDWVAKVLPERAFHFGTVARGSKVRHSYRLVNYLDRPLRIVDYRTKCGCTEVRLGAREVPPGTQTTIEAVIDTTKFLGEKKSGLTLIFDQPTFAEVDLDLSCFIRGDVWLTPGLVDFGVVNRSGTDKPTASLKLSYTGGQANWGITRMQTRTAQLSAKLHERDRSAGGTVQYELVATLDPRSSNGFFKDEITLHTNDPASPTIPVSVVGTVQASVTVSPSPLVVGTVKPDQVVSKTLLIRSSRPFQVKSVTSAASELSAAPVPEGAKPVHTVNVSFKAPREPGPYDAVLEIATDVPDEPPVQLRLFANVVP